MRKRRRLSDQFIRKEALGFCAEAIPAYLAHLDGEAWVLDGWPELDQAAFIRDCDRIVLSLLRRKDRIEEGMV